MTSHMTNHMTSHMTFLVVHCKLRQNCAKLCRLIQLGYKKRQQKGALSFKFEQNCARL